jgi:hypothetical protein
MSTVIQRIRGFGAGMIAVAGLSAALVGFGAASASAQPVNAPSSTTGTFNCGTVGSGTFVVNSGNTQAPVTWTAAHLTFTDGRTAVFQPRAFDLTFSFGGQTFTQIASKNGPGSTVCRIFSSQGGATLSGTVTGMVTFTP